MQTNQPVFAERIENKSYKANALAIKLEHAEIISISLETIISTGICEKHEQRDLYISSSLLLDDYKKCLKIEEQKIARLHDQMAHIRQDDASVSLKAFESWVDASLHTIDLIVGKLSHMEQLLSLSEQLSQAS